MNPLCLAQLTLEPIDGPEFVAAAAAAGFDSVDLRLRSPGSLAPGVKLPSVSEIKKALDDTGIPVRNVTSFWFEQNTPMHELEPVLDGVAKLGSEHFLVAVTDPEEGRALENFVRACELAAARNIKLAIEFMVYTQVRTLEQANRFVLASGQKNAGIAVDVLQLKRSGGSPASLAAIDPRLIFLAQFCDARLADPPPDEIRFEARSDRLHPGEGELWLDEFMDALPKNISLDLEIPCLADANLSPEAKAKKAAATTRKYLDRYYRAKSSRTEK